MNPWPLLGARQMGWNRMQRRRRLRRPVFSRLTWAWLGAFMITVTVAGVVARDAMNGGGVARVALPVEEIETFARVAQVHRENPIPTPPASNNAVSNNNGPALRDGSTPEAVDMLGGDPAEAAFGHDEDNSLTLIYPGENEMFDEGYDNSEEHIDGDEIYSGDGIVITIPGKDKPATSAQMASLSPAVQPIPNADDALLQTTALGQIPKISPDGRRAVKYYARSFDGSSREPKVALIIGGLGLNSAITERAIDDLPPEVSLSFAPYAKDLEFWTQKARNAGHEVLIELPMEGYGGNQQALGAAALLTSRTPQENLQRMDWLMSRFGGYFAATNYMGAKFTADNASLAPVLKKLKDAGVGYIDDTGAAKQHGIGLGLPMTTVSRMIPAAATDDDRAKVKRELAMLEHIAEQDGRAIGKTYAYATTIDEVVEWSRTLPRKGITPAPASALLQTSAVAR
ncbi:divergent polysaccharide deacetylase family protein [Hyphococcus lacteus]|uniref:Divergent polysaccharide deacetylase family protein n=1 Tax=Hyphococcus lacteus TaxID=3143536 RepID=A0ABV3Z3Q4_9PROT